MSEVNQPELNRLCALWQKRLRLEDWRVTVETVRHFDIPDCYGQTESRAKFKRAKIKILDSGDCEPAWVGERKTEETLVHELCHLFWPDASTEDDESQEFETMLNMVAEALVEAYRGEK